MRARCVLAWLFVAASVGAAPLYRGFSYTPWSKDALLSPDSDASIDAMKADGVDAVALNVWWFQDDERATEITAD